MADKFSAKLTDDDKILVRSSDGQEKEYEVVFSYEDDDSGKTYVAYTEYKVDQNGSFILSAYFYTDDKSNLKKVESKKDKQLFNEIWEQLQSEIRDQGVEGLLVDFDEEELSELQENINNVLNNMDIGSWISLMSANIDKAKEDEVHLLMDVADDVINKYFNDDYLEYKNELINLLRKIDLRLMMHSSMGSLGMKAYEHKDYATAEIAFTEAENWNNLAYMIRRGEVEDSMKYSDKYAAEILRDGVHTKDTFSMINMALLWALNIGGDEGWRLADKIMSVLSIDSISAAMFWWENVAKAGDIEGDLVHYWILKYGKLAFSTLGEKDDLLKKIRNEIPELPVYI